MLRGGSTAPIASEPREVSRRGALGSLLSLALDRSAAGAPRQAASTRPHKRSEVGMGEWRSAAAAKYYPTPCACDGGKYGFAPLEGGR